MKFQRINEDTIRCIVYKQDMQEYGIVLEDFFKNKSKIHDFLHDIVERAELEIGYTPKEGMLSMQIIPINPNMISITFSENMNDSYDSIINNIRSTIEDTMEEEYNAIEDDEYEEYDDGSSEYEPGSRFVDGGGYGYSDSDGMTKSAIVMIAMSSMEKLTHFCRTLNCTKTVTSELYYLRNRDVYCLIIEKNRLSEADMRQLLILAVEYTSNITDETKVIYHVREHGEQIIDKSAYRILKNYM